MLKTKEEISKGGIGVIVGRFQVPSLTEGHKDLIASVLQKHDSVIVVLGLSPIKATKANPLDFSTRQAMIQSVFPKVKVLYLNDVPDNNTWVKSLDKLIEQNTPPIIKVVLYGSRDSFIEAYQLNNGRYTVSVLEPDKVISGTRIRQQIASEVKTTEDYRHGVIWATQNQYDKVFCTVDIAIYKQEGESYKFLFASKNEDKGKLRFVGGFVQPGYDDDGKGDVLEYHARREVREETGIEIEFRKNFGSFFVDDWRYRPERDKIMTNFFLAEHKSGTPVPDDDIDHLEWISLDELKGWDFIDMKIIDTHKKLATRLKNSF